MWRKLGAGELTAWNLSLAAFALLCITTGTLYQKRFVAPCDVRSASAVQMFAALVVCAPLALFEREAMDWHPNLIAAMASFETSYQSSHGSAFNPAAAANSAVTDPTVLAAVQSSWH